MTDPPLRHWWLLALHKTVRALYNYDPYQYDKPGPATSATVEIIREPPPPAAQPPQQET